MRILVLFFATILALAFDSSFAGIFTLRSVGDLTPLALPTLVVFVALFAPEVAALISAMILGILVDLSPGHGELLHGAHLIGPNTLGLLVTTILVLKIRNVVFRRKIITIVFFAAGCVIVTGAVQALVLILRGFMPWTPPIIGGGFGELLKLFGTAIYTGLLAVPLGWCLLATIGMWKFHSPTGRRATWR